MSVDDELGSPVDVDGVSHGSHFPGGLDWTARLLTTGAVLGCLSPYRRAFVGTYGFRSTGALLLHLLLQHLQPLQALAKLIGRQPRVTAVPDYLGGQQD